MSKGNRKGKFMKIQSVNQNVCRSSYRPNSIEEELKKIKPNFSRLEKSMDEIQKAFTKRCAPNTSKVPKIEFALHEIKKPTLLTRIKRVPSVLLNILKHIK